MLYLKNTIELGRQIRLIRKGAKLSQADLAFRASLSRTAIQAIESGKETCQLDTLFKVLAILNIKLGFDHPLTKGNADA